MKKHLTGYLTATAILILLALALVACGGAAPEAETPAEETAPAEEAAEEPAAEEPAAEGGMMTEIGEGEGAVNIVASMSSKSLVKP